MPKRRTLILYAALAICSVAFIAVAGSISSAGALIFTGQTASIAGSYVVRVEEILDVSESSTQLGGSQGFTSTTIEYTARVALGERRGS
ncbi:MAG: hypothetical protein Q4B42_08125 [Oscillospiraceae bacterium]|nr:hypothetical protein [Oscillospiraceae bacterium]